MEPSSDKKTVLECEWCGEEFERYKYRVTDGPAFCSRECTDAYKGRNAIEEPCSNCGDSVTIPPSRQDSMGEYALNNTFCDKECEREWKSENWVGENHPSWDGGDTVVICGECGDKFEVTPAVAPEQQFCSKDCYDSSQQIEPLSLTCPVCGGAFEKKRHNVKGGATMCSAECFAEFQSQSRRGEGNPAWKGGPVGDYGGAWKRVRRDAIEAADGKCVLCGITTEEHREKYGRGLHGHHVTPVRVYEDVDEAHEKSEVLAVCTPCHSSADQYAPLRPRADMIAG